MSNLAGTKIKSLQVLISKLNNEVISLEQERTSINQQIKLKRSQVTKYENNVVNIQKNSKDIKASVKLVGSGIFNNTDFAVKIKDNVVVTVLDNSYISNNIKNQIKEKLC